MPSDQPAQHQDSNADWPIWKYGVLIMLMTACFKLAYIYLAHKSLADRWLDVVDQSIFVGCVGAWAARRRQAKQAKSAAEHAQTTS